MLRLTGIDLRCSRAAFSFAVAYQASDDQVWVIHDCAEGNSQRVTQFTTLVDRTWSFRVDMTETVRFVQLKSGIVLPREATRNRETGNEVSQAILVDAILLREESLERSLEPE
jgi:hypothetical protein